MSQFLENISQIPISIFKMDLPNLRRQPSYETLCRVLNELEVLPSSWGSSTRKSSIPADNAAVLMFLMSVISNDLYWLEDSTSGEDKPLSAHNHKEILLDLASKRVAERCGRSAMPEMTRTWVIPASKTLPELKFQIREPPLTGDNLGLKTWGSSFVIAKKLEDLGQTFLSHLLEKKDAYTSIGGQTILLPSARVLELGSGTGLVGIAAAAIWGNHVILTDLKEIEENLLFNIDQNRHSNSGGYAEFGGHMSGEVLDWNDTDEALPSWSSKEFEIIIATDPLYDDEHPALLANVVKKFLKDDPESRALIAVPLRDPNTKELAHQFDELMHDRGFSTVTSGEEVCHDDWESSQSEEVITRLAIWQRVARN